MSLTLVFSPETVSHNWHNVGTRRSIGGLQTVIAHESTKTRVILSPEGQKKFAEDEAFAKLLGDWAVLTTGNPIIREISKNLPAKNLGSSRPGINNWTPRFCSVYQPLNNRDTVIKSYDHHHKLAARQFDTMLYIKRLLKQSSETGIIIDAPMQYALTHPRKRSTHPAVFMERLSGVKIFGGVDDLQKELLGKLGPLGSLLPNDTGDHNWIFGQDVNSAPTYYILDQPSGIGPELPAALVPLGNLASRLLRQN